MVGCHLSFFLGHTTLYNIILATPSKMPKSGSRVRGCFPYGFQGANQFFCFHILMKSPEIRRPLVSSQEQRTTERTAGVARAARAARGLWREGSISVTVNIHQQSGLTDWHWTQDFGWPDYWWLNSVFVWKVLPPALINRACLIQGFPVPEPSRNWYVDRGFPWISHEFLSCS